MSSKVETHDFQVEGLTYLSSSELVLDFRHSLPLSYLTAYICQYLQMPYKSQFHYFTVPIASMSLWLIPSSTQLQ